MGHGGPNTQGRQQGSPRQPGPWGPVHQPKDLYTRGPASRFDPTQYIAKLRATLSIPPDDTTQFCFGCGAGHPHLNGLIGEYHPRQVCPEVAISSIVHHCPPPFHPLKLFHTEEQCPARMTKTVNNVIRITNHWLETETCKGYMFCGAHYSFYLASETRSSLPISPLLYLPNPLIMEAPLPHYM